MPTATYRLINIEETPDAAITYIMVTYGSKQKIFKASGPALESDAEVCQHAYSTIRPDIDAWMLKVDRSHDRIGQTFEPHDDGTITFT